MIQSKFFLYPFFAFLALLISSCMGVKVGGVKSGSKLFETFFVGDQGTQYFIKPLSFTNAEHETAKLDITFRYKNEIKDSATINVSFFHQEMFKNADSLVLKNEVLSVQLAPMTHLFCERKGKAYHCRYSTRSSLFEIDQLFSKNEWALMLYKNGTVTAYGTPKSTRKKLKKLDYALFSIF